MSNITIIPINDEINQFHRSEVKQMETYLNQTEKKKA